MTWKTSFRKASGILSWNKSDMLLTNTRLGLRQRRGSSKRSGWRVNSNPLGKCWVKRFVMVSA